MKKIIFCLAVSIASLSMAALTTYAAWTDSVSIAGSQVQTGTADLQVSTDSGTSWNNSAGTSVLALSGLVPGGVDTSGYSFSLLNNSSAGIAFNLSAILTGVNVSGSGSPDLTKVEIAIYPDGSTPESGSGWINLSSWQSATSNLNTTLSAGVANSKNFRLSARLVSSAGNEWQGRTITFGITVTGSQ